MKTNKNAALAAAHRIDPDRWSDGFGALLDRIRPRFARYEPLRHAGALMLGLLSGLDRKNCWTIAEHRGDSTPDGLQHLLSRAKWDADAVRDDLRGYVAEHLGDEAGILVVGETGDVKKGVHTVGTQRQYTGTAGRIENAQVAVYLTYAAPRGHVLIDRALYLPSSWTDDGVRRDAAGVPADVQFATKPALALQMITAALDAGVLARFVAGDEVYGNDSKLRTALAERKVGYVLAVSCDHRVPTAAGAIRADELARTLARRSWQKRSAGAGTKGLRFYSWAWLTIDGDQSGQQWLLLRRNDSTGELAYDRCYSPTPAPLAALVRVAGQRWKIEANTGMGESFQDVVGCRFISDGPARRLTSQGGPNIAFMTTSDGDSLGPYPLVHNASVAADESGEWVRALSSTGPVHDQAVVRLHAMLVRACHRELQRRRGQIDVTGPELEDIGYQAAADATMAVTAKISTFRGESRFTTWAYKFAVFEVSTKVGRHFWQKRTMPLDAEAWDRLPDRLGIDPAGQVQHQDLLAAVRRAVDTELSPRQRTVFVALVVEGIPLDALVERTGSNRNALYKAMFDARGKIRRSLVTNGYINDSDATQGKETLS